MSYGGCVNECLLFFRILEKREEVDLVPFQAGCTVVSDLVTFSCNHLKIKLISTIYIYIYIHIYENIYYIHTCVYYTCVCVYVCGVCGLCV